MIRILLRVWENFKEYIVLVVLLVTSLIIISMNQNPGIKNVRAFAFGSFAAITSVVTDILNITGVKNENERLRRVNAELMLQVNRLREFGIVNEELKRMLELKDSSNFPLIPSAVVSKSVSKSQSTFTINSGKDQGVKPGMPVINDQGLVGIVYSNSDDYSIVRTLKNRDLKLTVRDERSRVDGIMKWNGEDLVLIDVPKTYDIEPGDRIMTSELSSILSIPIPVGVVVELTKVETGIFNDVKLKPYVDFARVENVFVIAIVPSKQKNELELNFYNTN